MKPWMIMLTMAGLMFAAAQTQAVQRGDAKAGEQKAGTCVACHGEAGKSTNPAYPTLAGQYADYLARSLMAYQSGERQNAIMAGMAAPLSEEDIWDLAAYYASQSGKLYVPDRK